jgi:hypothetical protein
MVSLAVALEKENTATGAPEPEDKEAGEREHEPSS